MSPSLAAWMEARRPSVPVGFAPYMAAGSPEMPAGSVALAREARTALAESLALAPGDRDAAFRLLAADGFATWACEAALEIDDPDDALGEILDILLG